jgi:AraC family transcriptional regulator
MYQVEVMERPARRVIGVPHRGAYNQIGDAFGRLNAAVAAANLGSQAIEFLGVYFDDPGAVPEADLRSLAAIAVGEDVAMPADFEQAHLASGRFAVLHHRGPYGGLPAAWGWLMAEWLPVSGLRGRDAPACEVYRNAPGQVPEADLLTDICMPVR